MQTFTLSRRAQTARSTQGALLNGTTEICAILEGGADKSCAPHWRIPAGIYQLGFHGPSKFDVAPYNYPLRFQTMGLMPGHMIEVKGVPGRSDILIHPGDSFEDTDGCLLTGGKVIAGPNGDFIIPGGSGLAFQKVWPILSRAIDDDGAQLIVQDISTPLVA